MCPINKAMLYYWGNLFSFCMYWAFPCSVIYLVQMEPIANISFSLGHLYGQSGPVVQMARLCYSLHSNGSWRTNISRKTKSYQKMHVNISKCLMQQSKKVGTSKKELTYIFSHQKLRLHKACNFFLILRHNL